MNNINYYYLDGIDKKGPFTKDEIISKNLIPTTLIYFEGLANWIPLIQFEELKQPIINEQESLEKENIINKTNIPQITKTEPLKVKIPSFLFLIIAISLTTFLSYLYTNNEKRKDLRDIETKIDIVLQGKDEVCDFKDEGIRGELKNSELFTSNDNEGKRLVEYFKCEMGAGWMVLTLKRVGNGFELIESYSADMGFKVPESNYKSGMDLGYGNSILGYNIPTGRGTVQNAYKKAMNYISIDKENKSYVAGSYLNIRNFDDISTDLHYISNIEPTNYTDGSVFAKSWKSLEENSVFNSKWIVWYKKDGKHLEIVENQSQFNKNWLTYSLITGFITTVFFFFLKYRKRIALQMT